MGYFSYKAADQAGKAVKGVIEAPDEKGAAARLDEWGYIPIRIEPASDKAAAQEGGRRILKPFSFSRRVPAREVMLFTQDLSALLSAGLPLDRALKILIDSGGKRRITGVIRDVLGYVQKGHALSDALAQHPALFSHFYTNMVRAGEEGGVLEDVLERLGIYLESVQELKDYIKSALLYPAFLVGVGGISIILLLTFVIPRFSMIFEDMGQALPLATRILLGFSEGLRNWWWLILALVCGLLLALRYYARTEAGAYQLDRLKLRMVLVGTLSRQIEIARFSRTLGTLIHSGVPILKALKLVKDIIPNRIIASGLEQVHERVKEGESLAHPLADQALFPPLAIQMLTVGEETGRLDEMLLRVADNYEKSVRNLVKKYISLLEPVMILVMGVLIGFMVITMLMGIFSVNDLPF